MGFWQNLIGLEDEDDEDEIEEIEEVEEKKERKPLFKKREKEQEAEPEQKRELPQPQRQSSVSQSSQRQTSSTMSQKKFTNEVKMIVIKPQSFEESPKLVDSLKARKPVIINLEDLETDVARKIFDFLSGATYALNGRVQKIANNIFVFSPENVDVTYSEGTKKTHEEAPKSVWS